MRRPPRDIVFAWFGLMALLAVEIAAAEFAPAAAPVITLAVGAAMALILLGYFMELARAATLFRIFAGAGFVWLAILFFLTAADYLTRYSFARN